MLRVALFVLAFVVPSPSFGEAFSQRYQSWTLSCPDGKDQPTSCIAVANVVAADEPDFFVKAFADNGNDGGLKVIFFVSTEAKLLPHISIYVDPDMNGFLALQPCTANSCNAVWPLSKQQKAKLFSTEIMILGHATNTSDCIRTIRIALPTAGLEQALDELAKVRVH